MADDICFNGLPDLDFDTAAHYGIKDQKWGIRNYQYENGSYTPAGRERYRRGTGQRENGERRGPRRENYSREEEPKKSLKERFVARAKAEPGIIAKNIVKKHIPVFALKDDELRNINERLMLEESVLHLSGRLSPQDHRRTTHSVFTGLLSAGVKTIENFAVGGAKAFWEMKGGGKDSDPTKYEKITTTLEFDKNGENPKATKSVVEKHKKINHESSDPGVIFTGLPDLDENSLEHFGILGMKWGIRRFQNPDGTLTPEGKERYYKQTKKNFEDIRDISDPRNRQKLVNQLKKAAGDAVFEYNQHKAKYNKAVTEFYSEINTPLRKKLLTEMAKKGLLKTEDIDGLADPYVDIDEEELLSWNYYTTEYSKAPSDIKKLVEDDERLWKNITDAYEKEARELLGEFSDTPIERISERNGAKRVTTALKILSNVAMTEQMYNFIYDNGWKVY